MVRDFKGPLYVEDFKVRRAVARGNRQYQTDSGMLWRSAASSNIRPRCRPSSTENTSRRLEMAADH